MSVSGRRVAVVTGAARGLGRAYAIALAKAGIDVVAADVADIDSCRECVARVTKDIGPIDILVNNAGITKDTTFKKMSKADWDAVIRTNLDSVFNMTKQVMDGMTDRGWGRVINVSSNTVGLVISGFLAYVTSKAGIIGFTRALASEVGPSGITVNAVMPGLTRTEATLEEEAAGRLVFDEMAAFQPIPRILETDDLADVVVFLASDGSRMMTGQTLVVDGGIIRL